MKLIRILLFLSAISILSSCSGKNNNEIDNFKITDKIFKFSFMDKKDYIWISDPAGKESFNTNLKSEPYTEGYIYYRGYSYYGSGHPLISPDEKLMAFIDPKSNLRIYNLQTKENKIIYKNIHGRIACSIFICSWLNNEKLVFLIDGNYDLKISGFYAYDANGKNTDRLNELNGVLDIVPDTQDILTFKGEENELYLFNVEKKEYIKKGSLRERCAQIDAYDENNYVYIYDIPFRGIYIAYYDMLNKKEELIRKSRHFDKNYLYYQFARFVSKDIISYYKYSKGNKRIAIEKMIIYDIKSKKEKSYNIKSREAFRKNNWVIYLNDNALSGFNFLTNETFIISKNVKSIRTDNIRSYIFN